MCASVKINLTNGNNNEQYLWVFVIRMIQPFANNINFCNFYGFFKCNKNMTHLSALYP